MNYSKITRFTGILILILLFQFQGSAQGWNKLYKSIPNDTSGLTVIDQAYSVLQTLDGGYVFSGYSGTTTGPSTQLFLTKTDFAGNVQWISSFGDSLLYNEGANDIKMTNDGGYIACGYRRIAPSQNKAYVVRTDALGNLVWEKEYGTSSSNQAASSVLPLNDGGFLLVGFTDSWGANGIDVMLMKIDSQGNQIWLETYGSNDLEIGQKIAATPDGGYAISAYTYDQAGSNGYDIYALKIDSNFNAVWSNTYGGVETDWVYDIDVFPNGDILLTGQTASFGAGGIDIYSIRLDDLGNTIWENTFGTAENNNGKSADLTTDGGVIITGGSRKNPNTDENSYLLKLDAAGNQQFYVHFPIGCALWGEDVVQTSDGGYIHTGGALFAGIQSFLIKTDSLGNIHSNNLIGNVFNDIDLSCDLGVTEEGIEDIIIKAESPDFIYYATTDDNGDYSILVDTGLYEVTAILPNAQWSTCNSPFTVNVNTFYQDYAEDIPFQLVGDCPYMLVDISTGILRPCQQAVYSVSYANLGAPLLQSGSIEIEIDTFLTVISSSLPWISQVGNVYTFDIGILSSFEEGSFTILTELDCDSSIVGMTHCAIAHIFPDTICVPLDPLWDGSSIEIIGDCTGDSATFLITNTGSGNMNNGGDYLVIEDQLMLMQGMILLQAGEDTSLTLYPNGTTLRLEIEQAIGHPGNSNPSVVIEGCGNGPISTGFVTMYPENDGDPFISIDCEESVASFDPNDKAAYPKGYGSQHFIEANTDIEYKIRFQNTGTDTAFYIEIIDTLSELLDPETILAGSSSHPYDFQLFGNGVVRFIFNDIELPQEAIDESGSQGFVKFRIKQDVNNPIGSEIYNSAAIYFDFNAPIITNNTWHQIGEDFIEVITNIEEPGSEFGSIALKVFPNPFEQTAIFELSGSEETEFQFELISLAGQAVRRINFTGTQFEFHRDALPSGLYLYQITSETGIINTGKIMIK